MGHGLRLLRLMLAALGVLAIGAGGAHAYVYWTVSGAGLQTNGTTLGRADLDGSAVNHAFVTGASEPEGIAVDGNYVYWTDALTNSIGRAKLDGTDVTPNFIPNAASTGTVSSVATDGAYLYWTDANRYVGRAALNTTLKNSKFIDAGPGSIPLGIAVANGTIYLSEFGQIVHVPVTGGTPQTLVSLPNDAVAGLTAANGFIYAATINTTVVPPAPAGAIARVQLSSSTVDQTYIPSLSFPSGVAVDGTHVYWVDRGPMVNTIGRAVLGTSGATDVQPSFISEPGGPTDVAVDGGIDPTTTSVTCNPASVAKGNPTTCTATVHDAASSTPPTGTVNVTGDATTFFQGNPCQLTPLAAGGGSSCVVGADPTNAGTQTITAAYGGDAVHQASSGTLALCAGTTDPCGSTAPPPPPKPNCVVPKLKGKSLTTARKLLHKAHCTLGKVKRPRHSRHHHLVVGSQSPRAGKRLANDAKVNVKLVRAHRH